MVAVPTPTLHYDFAGSGTTAIDATGNGNDGALTRGGSPFDLHSGGKLSLNNGTGDSLQYNPTTDPVTHASVTMTIDADNIDNGGLWVLALASDTSGFNFWIQEGNIYFIGRTVDSIIVHNGGSGTDIPSAGTWRIAATHDGDAGVFKIYVNGVEVYGATGFTGALRLDSGSGTGFRCGANPLLSMAPTLTVDDLRWWDTVTLTAAQVAAIASGTAEFPSTDPPVAYTELEWSIGVQAPAVVGEVYEFRVRDGATPLADYLVTAQLSVEAEPTVAAIPTATMRLDPQTPTGAVGLAPAELDQEGFRWRNDDGSEVTATWLAAQDTNTSLALVGAAPRLRFVVDTTAAVTITPTLRYKKTTDSIWLPVPVGPASVIETWTGANGSSWPASRWEDVAAQAAPGVVDIQSNAGRMVADGGSTFGARARSVVSKTDHDWTVKSTFDSTATSLNSVGVRCGTAWGGNGGNVNLPLVGYLTRYEMATGTLRLWRYNSDTTRTDIGSVVVGANVGPWWTRVQMIGTALKVKMWLASGSEPGTWNLEVTDSAHSSGRLVLVHFNESTGARTVTWDDLTDNLVPVYIKTSSNIASGGEPTTALLTAPSGKTTADFSVGRMWDDENGTDSVTI